MVDAFCVYKMVDTTGAIVSIIAFPLFTVTENTEVFDMFPAASYALAEIPYILLATDFVSHVILYGAPVSEPNNVLPL